ncbi:hypothetical protein PHYSODRAFT_302290 [Phytophthora sojae]|uniref:Uncharacterized protein n=1 Tax=Phytophthora sojae (strain P6497) TaxID=1094619 RepID=G4ZQM5_PHYSP|nr:hypothetical protein PHYSODRAFT_302290 [Phytophthora sojae]EGZ15882.1 hypothetical protein PHYSODRAFT_302290 [Phytophthora sojae]|eukprot:XP_009529631.1 hypothetical protein PHYSODRAFT_302290 [Phytophthora sojae]
MAPQNQRIHIQVNGGSPKADFARKAGYICMIAEHGTEGNDAASVAQNSHHICSCDRGTYLVKAYQKYTVTVSRWLYRLNCLPVWLWGCWGTALHRRLRLRARAPCGQASQPGRCWACGSGGARDASKLSMTQARNRLAGSESLPATRRRREQSFLAQRVKLKRSRQAGRQAADRLSRAPPPHSSCLTI